MKSNLGKKARLVALLALVAVLPLGIGACGDGGDSESGPTGPSTKYNPDIDYPGATITAVVTRSSVAAGGEFDILATFKDGNGLPVQGVPLVVGAESGGAKGDFSYKTNPTLTDRNGKASIGVVVSASCPSGSYSFAIYSVRAAQAIGYVGVEVGGGTAVGTEAITSVALTTSTPTVVAGSAANFNATATGTPVCNEEYLYQATGGGLGTTAWAHIVACDGMPSCNFSVTPTGAEPLTVQVAASCFETGMGTFSPVVSVTVTAAP